MKIRVKAFRGAGMPRATLRPRLAVGILLGFLLTLPMSAQQAQTRTPDREQVEYYRDYAVITTECRDWDEAYALARAIVEKGGVVSTLLSPQRFLGFVPAEARSAVEALDRVALVRTTPSMQKEAVSGPYAEDVAAGLEYFAAAKSGLLAKQDDAIAERMRAASCLSPNDGDAFRAFLAPLGTLSDSVARAKNVPAVEWQGRVKDSLQSLLGIPRGVLYGVINVEVFMLESTGAGAVGNWTTENELFQIAQIFRAFDFLSRSAARYGKTLSFRATFYRPSLTTVVRVTGEPVMVPNDQDFRLVRQVMRNLGYADPWGGPAEGWAGAILTLGLCIPCDLAAVWSVFPEGTEKAFVNVMKWNDRRSEELRVDQTISYFIKLITPGSSHRAYARSAGTGYIGGRISIPELRFSLDLPDLVIGPYAMLNSELGGPVIAHETMHLFGAPDEYRENEGDTDCPQPAYFFRGTGNANCMVLNTNAVRALMRDNNEFNFSNNEISSAAANFVAWGPRELARPIFFGTQPAGIPVTLPVDMEAGPSLDRIRPLFLALGYAIQNVSVPAEVTVGGTRYYFDGWYEGANRSASLTRTVWGATRSVIINNTVGYYEARYTTTGGGITAANNTLEGRLGSPGPVAGTNERAWQPGGVLVWRSTLTGSGGSYVVQQRNGTNWNDVPAGYYAMGVAAPGYWYADLSTASFIAGSASTFRVVPVTQAGARGTPSNEVAITPAPPAPIRSTFGYDGNEPNNTATTATPVSFNAATGTPVSVDGSIMYKKQPEFGYYFDIDHFALTASGLSGTSARVTVVPKQGSVFDPYVTYKPTPTSSPVEARRSFTGGYFFDVTADGSVSFTVAARRSSFDLIDLANGVGNWGEYTVTVSQVPPLLSGIDQICPECRYINRIPTGGGRIYPFNTEIPSHRLFTQQGLRLTAPLNFGFVADPDPGFEFTGWEGHFPGTKNPDTRVLNPQNDGPGERMLLAKFTPLPQGEFELVYDVPEAWQSVLGAPKRFRGVSGEEIDLELPKGGTSGFDFLGWGGNLNDKDVVSPVAWRYAQKIRVKLLRHLLVKPILVPRPCTTGGPAAFTHVLRVTTVKNETTTLTYGMQAGAGDGLESGQVELPPPPPTAVHDARFKNIDGAAQGSLTDIRAIKGSHTYTGTLQPGENGNPLMLTWDPISPTVTGSFVLAVGSESVNMRATTSLKVDAGTSSGFTIEVTQDTCRELPRTEISVAVSDVDASSFPFIRGRVCVTDKQGNPILNVRPSDAQLFEKKGGQRAPAILIALRPADDCYIFEGFLDNGETQDVKNRQRSFGILIALRNPSGQDDKDVTITLPVPDPGTETGNGNGQPNTAYKVTHGDGWQLVSLPVMLTDSRVNSVFGDGSVRSPLYGFDTEQGYRTTDALTFGKGYWLRFAGTGEGRVNGIERTIFDVTGLPGTGQAAADGWNLIGGISYDVPLASISQTPSNAIISLFEYNAGYKPATVLKPGAGYWVKLRPNATLKLVKPFAGSGGGATKSAAVETDHARVVASLPRAATFSVSDAGGRGTDLFLAPDAAVRALTQDERVAAELPPTPPSSAFDARFAGDAGFAPDAGEQTLRLQGAAPWRIHMTDGTGAYTFTLQDGTPLGTLDARAGSGIMVPAPADGGNITRVLVRKTVTQSGAPALFALGQNYPNPFRTGVLGSVATSLSYDVAAEQTVTLTVYDALGRVVRTLVSGLHAAGRHTAQWDGRETSGRPSPAGTYLVELRAGDTRITRHMIIVK
ncbi:MAG: T9SS type A sorting domain-containing protein [Ignavibacteriae bacterium]|nr:T9SS type A sorting domain-containing protein [Ignavibacteriota bacterium]